MAKWQETKCCGTCALLRWNFVERPKRISPDHGGHCLWQMPDTMQFPESVTASYGYREPKPGRFMRRDDGADCPCYEPLTPAGKDETK